MIATSGRPMRNARAAFTAPLMKNLIVPGNGPDGIRDITEWMRSDRSRARDSSGPAVRSVPAVPPDRARGYGAGPSSRARSCACALVERELGQRFRLVVRADAERWSRMEPVVA